MQLSLGGGHIVENVVPVIYFGAGRSLLELGCGDIRENVAGGVALGIVDVFGGNAVVDIVSGSICSNDVANDASGLLVSTSTGASSSASAIISVSTGNGDIANNSGGIVFLPESDCDIETVTYDVDNPNFDCSVLEALSQPTSIIITEAPAQFFDGEPFELTVLLTQVETSVGVEMTFQGEGVELLGQTQAIVELSGFATFSVVLSGTGTGFISVGVRNICEPLVASRFAVVLPLPSATPSQSPSRSASFVAIPTSRTPSISPSRSSNFAEQTPLAPFPEPQTVTPVPSRSPSPITASPSPSPSPRAPPSGPLTT